MLNEKVRTFLDGRIREVPVVRYMRGNLTVVRHNRKEYVLTSAQIIRRRKDVRDPK